jgi:hypothetical protein
LKTIVVATTGCRAALRFARNNGGFNDDYGREVAAFLAMTAALHCVPLAMTKAMATRARRGFFGYSFQTEYRASYRASSEEVPQYLASTSIEIGNLAYLPE